jgi:hypothetical protein
MECFFCRLKAEQRKSDIETIFYDCDRCGTVVIERTARLLLERLTDDQRLLMSIYMRNKSESSGGRDRHYYDLTSTESVKSIIGSLKKLDPIEQMERALLNLNAKCKYTGDDIELNHETDYPYYYCLTTKELQGVLQLLSENDYIALGYRDASPNQIANIRSDGYQLIRELKARRKDFKQCFVAMWFNPSEMDGPWKTAIKPAIEYIEEGQTEPTFKAVRADTEEYATDINDWIISEIRRSRFMVCDLTGYRGGVYFEAGFAYGLGLPVIYTCRKDWCEAVKEASGKVIKEGVHFDLNHQNRIEWEEKRLDTFRDKLTNRIKAIIL